MSGYATPATVKQENYINRLMKGRANFDGLNPGQHAVMKRMLDAEVISKDDASYLISGLLSCAEKPRGPMADPGYYVKPSTGAYLVVVANKAGTATYAKRLVVTKEDGKRAKAKWEYAPGEAAEVAHLKPMTLDEAAKFGHAHGVCFVCCRALTDPESVKNGIGPVCAKKFGRPAPKVEQPSAALVTPLSPEPTINVAALQRRNKRR